MPDRFPKWLPLLRHIVRISHLSCVRFGGKTLGLTPRGEQFGTGYQILLLAFVLVVAKGMRLNRMRCSTMFVTHKFICQPGPVEFDRRPRRLFRGLDAPLRA
jgi:hypothetical protein